MDRRSLLASAGTVSLAGLAGCLGLAGLDEHASKAGGIEQSVLEDSAYESAGVEEIRVEREVGFSLYQETVSVTNQLTKYEKSVDMGPLGSRRGAVFLVLTTPQVRFLGKKFNPVKDMDTKELVELVEDNYDAIGNISYEDDEEITILEQDTIQSRFNADAQFDGQNVDVFLHVTEAIESNDDYLVTVGVYPEPLRADEEDTVLTFMESVIGEFTEANDEAAPNETDNETSTNELDGDDDSGDDGEDSQGDDDGDDSVGL